jgi:hypothetical protein
MASKEGPDEPTSWPDHERDAAQRRLRASWQRGGDMLPPRRPLDSGRLLTIVIILCALAIFLCLALPA